MSRRGPEDFANETGPLARRLAGLVRRMTISRSTGLWQVSGHRLLDNTTETHDAEPFTGIGFYSRPPATGKPEAIAVFSGDTGKPVIVATRDEKTRQAMAGSLAEDETAIFNSSSIILMKADGTVRLGSSNAFEAAIKGTTYRVAEDALLTALGTLATAINVFAATCTTTPPATPAATLNTATIAFTAAMAAFQSGAATYLATKVKVE